METARDYLTATESAIQTLFVGMQPYLKLLRNLPVYVGWLGDDAGFQRWQIEQSEAIATSLARQRQFSASTFALATLCGSVLQVAAKAIEVYSTNTVIPDSVANFVEPKHAAAVPFCIGREINGLPLGLIIYAGRNQHIHYNEPKLAAVNRGVFARLACAKSDTADPAFDLDNPRIDSFAHNVTGLIGWRSYGAYLADMAAMLPTGSDPVALPPA